MTKPAVTRTRKRARVSAVFFNYVRLYERLTYLATLASASE